MLSLMKDDYTHEKQSQHLKTALLPNIGPLYKTLGPKFIPLIFGIVREGTLTTVGWVNSMSTLIGLG